MRGHTSKKTHLVAVYQHSCPAETPSKCLAQSVHNKRQIIGENSPERQTVLFPWGREGLEGFRTQAGLSKCIHYPLFLVQFSSRELRF